MPAGGNRLIAAIRRLAPPADGSDAELLGRFVADRDEAAFEALVRRHGPMVHAACRRELGPGPDADDAFQVAFLVLARDAGRISTPAALPGRRWNGPSPTCRLKSRCATCWNICM